MRRESGPPRGAAPRTPAKEFDTPQGSTRPPLGMTTDEREFRLAQAHAAIAAAGRAQHAVRLLEFVDRTPVPHVNAPRWLAGQLRALADELEDQHHHDLGEVLERAA